MRMNVQDIVKKEFWLSYNDCVSHRLQKEPKIIFDVGNDGGDDYDHDDDDDHECDNANWLLGKVKRFRLSE